MKVTLGLLNLTFKIPLNDCQGGWRGRSRKKEKKTHEEEGEGANHNFSSALKGRIIRKIYERGKVLEMLS